jgi:hypothetical protein
MAAYRRSSKNIGKMNLQAYYEQKFITGSYGVRIGRAWCSRKACEICSSLVQKKVKNEKKSFFFTQAAQTAIDQFLVSRNFRG